MCWRHWQTCSSPAVRRRTSGQESKTARKRHHGPGFIAKAVQHWLGRIGVKTLYITPGSPWENGYCESFNGSLRDELLDGEIFYTLAEAKVLIEAWRRHYNTIRPHSSLGYRPPAPEAATPPVPPSGSASLHLRPTLAENALMH
jgi:transposase InsO family protein